MLTFIDKGFYSFHAETRLRFPLISKLDYHIHAYLAGAKYQVPALCSLAIKMYTTTAQMALDDVFAVTTTTTTTATSTSTPPPLSTQHTAPHHPLDRSPAAELDRFLDSLVLVWRNTPDRSDAMRCAALGVVKHFLSRLVRVKFFCTLMLQLEGFGVDVVHAVGEDGVEVRVFRGSRGEVRFGEGGARLKS